MFHFDWLVMVSINVAFKDFGIMEMAKALGVKHVDKFISAKNYRATRRVMLMLWSCLEQILPQDIIGDRFEEEKCDEDEAENDEKEERGSENGPESDGIDSFLEDGRENEDSDEELQEDLDVESNPSNLACLGDMQTINSDECGDFNEIVEVLQFLRRRRLREWVALLVAVETGDGALMISSIRSICPLFAVTNRRNYSVLAAEMLISLIGPSASSSVMREIWEMYPFCQALRKCTCSCI